MKNEKKTEELRKLFPGREVPIEGVMISVRCLSVRELIDFSEAISETIPKVLEQAMEFYNQAEEGDETEEVDFNMPKVIQAILPFAMRGLVPILDRCIDVDIEVLPHHALPTLMEAWLQESFGDPKFVRAWADALSSLTQLMASKAQESAIPQE